MTTPIVKNGARLVIHDAVARGRATTPVAPVAKLTGAAAVKVSIGKESPAPSGVYTRALAAPKASYSASAPAATPLASALADPAAYVAGDGPVVVDVMHSDSGYENRIYWSSDNWQTANFIGIDDQTATVNLGTFKPGTKLEFGIDNGNGDFFRTGSAAANSDNFQHAKVSRATDGVLVGFEDLRGGGDRDFNDAFIKVRSLPAAVPAPARVVVPAPAKVAVPAPAKVDVPAPARVVVPAPAKTVVTVPAKRSPAPAKTQPVPDNRSGLGDGTNPGQGVGTVRSPNTGTNNPGGVKKLAR